jgi:outer membrane biosynthesis protein TonB
LFVVNEGHTLWFNHASRIAGTVLDDIPADVAERLVGEGVISPVGKPPKAEAAPVTESAETKAPVVKPKPVAKPKAKPATPAKKPAEAQKAETADVDSAVVNLAP